MSQGAVKIDEKCQKIESSGDFARVKLICRRRVINYLDSLGDLLKHSSPSLPGLAAMFAIRLLIQIYLCKLS